MNKSFKIEGMTCSACANRVERVVKKIEGVNEANVNFATETLTVKFDDNTVNNEKIELAVEKAGYKVKKNIKSYTLKVEGMTCSACANRIERVTKKLDGVESSVVNFATEKLTVKMDEDTVTYGQVKAVVEKAGFKLIKEEEIKNQKKKLEDKNILLIRFIISVIFTLPLLVISMGHMLGMPLPSIIDPMMNPLNFAIVQTLSLIHI